MSSSKASKRTRSQLPTRTVAPIRGKRSGVSMKQSELAEVVGGTQEMEDFFEAHQPNNTNKEITSARKQKQTNTPKKKGKAKAKKTKTPKSKMKMKLPGARDDDDDGDDDDHEIGKAVKKYSQKLKPTMSPSELSNVSTAPPTPHDEVEGARFAQDDEEEELMPEDDGGEQEDEMVSASQAAEKAATGDKPQLLETQEETSPSQFNVEDDGEMDLGPPAQSDEDDFDMGPPDHDDDDDKEGDGFNMVHDPETPASVRQKRKEEEKAELQKERRKKKQKVQKKKRHVVFSPQGIPTAPRSYQSVPVADYVEPSPEEGIRRSRRAKCKPLAYWKNEKFEYGAHDETGVLGEAMGDMPIVVNVIKALPTPYKKRTESKKGKKKAAAGGRKKNADAESVVEEEEEFDTRKLRKKYNVVDGEIANIWDDTADDSVDLSKWCLNHSGRGKEGKILSLTHVGRFFLFVFVYYNITIHRGRLIRQKYGTK